MIRCLGWIFLLIVSFLSYVHVQESVKNQNALIQINNNCTCVPQDRCNENNEIITNDPALVIQRRVSTQVKRILCQTESPSVKEYCCKQAGYGDGTTTTTIKPVDSDFAMQNAILEVFNNCKCVPEDQCGDSNDIADNDPSVFIQRRTGANSKRLRCQSDPSVKLYCCTQLNNDSTKPAVIDKGPDEAKCGVGISGVEPRILNKDDDETPGDGEFPWMVAVFNKSSSGSYQLRCGGSLIHPKVVLTAMHCVYRKRPRDLVVGANGKTQVPNKDEERRHISEIVKHPRYAHFGRLYNDAALLILEKPFPTSGNNRLNTLCLPPSSVDLEELNCYVIGWGNGLSGQRDQNLKKVELPFVEHGQCQKLFRATRLGQDFRLHDSFMCAGGEEGKDSCIGDGGSPLMCIMPSEEERYFQAGIVSWGIGCGKEDVPGAYTDVEKITEWIKSELAQRKLEI